MNADAQTFDESGVRDVFVRLERSEDMALIRSIIEHPGILPFIWDKPDRIPVYVHMLIHNMIAYLDSAVIGIVTFVPLNSITWNPHISILPDYRGHGTAVMRAATKWMFEKTGCRKICAFPPTYNKPMIRVFEKCGYKHEGFSPRSFEFKGIICDRLLMGIEK